MNVLAGSTDVSAYFKLKNTDGTPATGLAVNGFDLQYVRFGAAPSTKVDATALAATNTAHTDNYGIEIDATDQPGLYRFDFPDAAFASGVRGVILTVKHTSILGGSEDLFVDLTPVPANVTMVNSDTAVADYLKALSDGNPTRVADSGTTTTLVDAALTQSDDYWNGMLVVFTAGPNSGLARTITDFVASSDTVTFSPALPNAVGTGDEYELTPSATLLAEILADTNELQGDWANGGRLDNILDARASQTSVDDLPTNAELASALATADDAVLAAITALNNLSAAQVNAEMLDVLTTDTFSEPTGVPGATISLAERIRWLYMALRNKVTVTAAKKTFFDDGDAAEWEKDLTDDGTTYTESEANAI